VRQRQERIHNERKIAEVIWGQMPRLSITILEKLVEKHSLSIALGELLYLNHHWYVTHSGLLTIANRQGCTGIQVNLVDSLCNASANRWTFRSTVYRAKECQGFVGFGDANPSNTPSMMHGSEMRLAETRAVNRALRKAYGIGICSIEELKSRSNQRGLPTEDSKARSRNHPQSHSLNLRDHLYQIIRDHQLNPSLVKAYAIDYCGVKELRDATRDQIANLVAHLAHWAEKDRDSLLCQLNAYPRSNQGVH
jgi:hypothetical protein